jgi:sulfite reductase alpha subunit-like flavoprotein
VKYSGPKKENSNRLIEKFLEMIKNDRYYAKKAPLWTAQVLRIRHAFFHYFDLFDKSSGSISRIDDDDEDEQDFGTNNDEETAQEREKREEPERDLARVLERV